MDLIRETTPSSICIINDAPLGGECIEQPRTIIIRIRAFISSISKIPLTVPLLNYQKKTNIPFWCFLHNFPRDLVLREVEEGVVRIIQPQFPRRGTVRKPIMFLYQGNTRGVFHHGICLDIDHHFIVRRTHSLGQGITWAKPIESSEPNSHSYPRLPIDVNQIK